MRILSEEWILSWVMVVSAIVSLGASARAQDSDISQKRSTVILVSTRNQRQDTICERAKRFLIDELEYEYNLNVVEHIRTDTDDVISGEMLKSIAVKNRAKGTVHIFRTTEDFVSAAVLTIDRTTGDVFFQAIDVEITPAADASETIALRVAEVIYAKIVDHTDITPETVSAKAALPAKTPSPAPRMPHLDLQLTANFSGEFSPGGTGFFGGPGLEGIWRPLDWLATGIDVAWFFVGSDIQKGDKTASFDMLLSRLKVAYQTPIGTRFRITAGIGTGAGFLWTKGSSDDDAVSTKTDRSVMVYVGGFCAMRMVITKSTWLSLSLAVGTLPPGVTIDFEGEKVASIGLPIIEAGLGVGCN